LFSSRDGPRTRLVAERLCPMEVNTKRLYDPIGESPVSITQPQEESFPEISLLTGSLNAPAAQADAQLCLYSARPVAGTLLTMANAVTDEKCMLASLPAELSARPAAGTLLSMANAVADEKCMLASLPAELLAIVAESLDTHCLACFAATSDACLAAALDELHGRAALLAVVRRCLEPGGIGTLAAWCIGGMNALVSHPHFRLPNDLVTIPSRAFAGSTSLAQLSLPATVTTIGDGAFAGCCSLTELTIPTDAALTKIGSRAFKGTALTSITLPASVTTIGHRAFKHCASLTSVTLPDTVTIIGTQAFYGSSLSQLTLPAALTTLGEKAFDPSTCLKHPWSMHPPNHPQIEL